jgi:hypothetical protein
MRTLSATLGLCLGLSACVSSGSNVSMEQARQFQKGVTTEQQVEAALGAASAVTEKSDGTRILVYTHIDARPDAVTFVPIVGAFAGGASSHLTVVSFKFDAHGVLSDYTATATDTHVNTGLAH